MLSRLRKNANFEDLVAVDGLLTAGIVAASTQAKAVSATAASKLRAPAPECAPAQEAFAQSC
jgi:hypothetical protein